MKSKTISISLAVLALLFGVVWLWRVLVWPTIRGWSEDPANWSNVSFFIILSMMSLPGILAVYFGIRLLKESNEKNIKRAVGILMVALVVWGIPLMLARRPKGADETIAEGILWLIGTVIAVIIYLILAKWALRASGFPVAGIREVMGRVPLLLIALQIWMVGSRLFDVYSPKKGGYASVPEEPWVFMGLFPILAAWLFYRISIKAFGIKTPEAGFFTRAGETKH
ncbi:MAG: hypothetical protein WA117_15675 [Verrucomicrobiia bacterium]